MFVCGVFNPKFFSIFIKPKIMTSFKGQLNKAWTYSLGNVGWCS